MITNEPSMSRRRDRNAWCCCSCVSGSTNAPVPGAADNVQGRRISNAAPQPCARGSSQSRPLHPPNVHADARPACATSPRMNGSDVHPQPQPWQAPPPLLPLHLQWWECQTALGGCRCAAACRPCSVPAPVPAGRPAARAARGGEAASARCDLQASLPLVPLRRGRRSGPLGPRPHRPCTPGRCGTAPGSGATDRGRANSTDAHTASPPAPPPPAQVEPKPRVTAVGTRSLHGVRGSPTQPRQTASGRQAGQHTGPVFSNTGARTPRTSYSPAVPHRPYQHDIATQPITHITSSTTRSHASTAPQTQLCAPQRRRLPGPKPAHLVANVAGEHDMLLRLIPRQRSHIPSTSIFCSNRLA